MHKQLHLTVINIVTLNPNSRSRCNEYSLLKLEISKLIAPY